MTTSILLSTIADNLENPFVDYPLKYYSSSLTGVDMVTRLNCNRLLR